MEPPLRIELMRRAHRVAEILASRGLHVAFIGGLAMNAWSIPVPTYDIDLCADIDPADVADVIRSLEADGFIPPPTAWLESVGPAKFQEFTVHFPHGTGLRPVDVYLATDGFQAQALARRRPVELDEGFSTAIVSPEDLLIYKLLAWRPKDVAAIQRLLAVQQDLDWNHVRRWAKHFGVEDRLSQALRSAGLQS